jgi:O-antigen ligase
MARTYMNQIAMNMIEARPIIGFGWNNYTLYFHEYDDTEIGHSYLFPYMVHNGYLFMGVEYGLGAMFLVLWIWLKVIRTTLHIRPKGLEYQQMMAFFFPWIFLSRIMQTPLYVNNPITSIETWYMIAMCLVFKEWCDEDDQIRAEGGTPESLVNQI